MSGDGDGVHGDLGEGEGTLGMLVSILIPRYTCMSWTPTEVDNATRGRDGKETGMDFPKQRVLPDGRNR